MTKETRIIFEVSDISRVRVKCAECEGEITYKLDAKRINTSSECPHCGQVWFSNESPLRAIVGIMRRLLVPAGDGWPISIRFEISSTTEIEN